MTIGEYSCSSMVNYVLGFEEMLNTSPKSGKTSEVELCGNEWEASFPTRKTPG